MGLFFFGAQECGRDYGTRIHAWKRSPPYGGFLLAEGRGASDLGVADHVADLIQKHRTIRAVLPEEGAHLVSARYRRHSSEFPYKNLRHSPLGADCE